MDVREYRLFRSLDVERQGRVRVSDLYGALDYAGLSLEDGRLRESVDLLRQFAPGEFLTYKTFCESVRPSILLFEQALQGELGLPCPAHNFSWRHVAGT